MSDGLIPATPSLVRAITTVRNPRRMQRKREQAWARADRYARRRPGRVPRTAQLAPGGHRLKRIAGRHVGKATANVDSILAALQAGTYDKGVLVFYDVGSPGLGSMYPNSAEWLSDATILGPDRLTLTMNVYKAGTPVSARLYDYARTAIHDFTVGAAGSGADIILTGGTMALMDIITISLSSTTLTGSASATGSSTDPVLPRITVDTSALPTVTGTTWSATDLATLQTAFTNAVGGDEIVIADGVTIDIDANLTVPNRADTGFVLVRSNGVTTGTLARGTRMTPATATSLNLGKLRTTGVSPIITLNAGQHGYWFRGVEMLDSGTQAEVQSGLFVLGAGIASPAGMPAHIILEQCYIHANSAASQIQNGVMLDGRDCAVIDSYINEIHWPGVETHGVVGFMGQGPIKIENNYVEAAGINIFWGGADAPWNVVTTDVEIKRNHCFKPVAWQSASPMYAVKNLVELKNIKRVHLRGNVIENSWPDAQVGYGFIFQSLTDNPTAAPWTGTADLTYQYNVVRNANYGFNCAAHGYNGSGRPVTRVLIEHTWLDGIGVPDGWINQPNEVAAIFQVLGGLQGLRIRHNTGWKLHETDGHPFLLDLDSGTDFYWNDNVLGSGTPYDVIFKSGGQLGQVALAALCSAGPWSFDNNLAWANVNGATGYPATNHFAADLASCGFTNPVQNGDWSLSAASAYKGTATDATDPGVDWATLQSEIAGVV